MVMKINNKELSEIVGNLKCPKCNGSIFKDGDEAKCINCGYGGNEFITKGMSRAVGRTREGKYTKCVDCGADLYIRKHRLEEGKEFRCRSCASKVSAAKPRKKTGRPAGVKDKVTRDCDTEKNKKGILFSLYTYGIQATLATYRLNKATIYDLRKRWEISSEDWEKILSVGQVPSPPKQEAPNQESSWLKITTELIEDWQTDLNKLKDRVSQLENEITLLERTVGTAQTLIQAYKNKYPTKVS